MKLLKVAAITAVSITLILFIVFVWPTQWKTLPLKTMREEQFQQRQNRFTDVVETWIPSGTSKVGGRELPFLGGVLD